MKVIGAGFGRTGTVSTQRALQLLGYRCYHMNEIMGESEHLRAWYEFASGKTPMNWGRLFQHFDATVDFPTCLFYRELLDEFPDAKVVLNVRDPNRWYDSWSKMWRMKQRWRMFRFIPRLHKIHSIVDTLVFENLFSGNLDREYCIAVYHRHIEEIKRTVPANKLLLFSVKDGWEPLCDFLGKEIPKEKPFLHLNEGNGSVWRHYARHALGRFRVKNAVGC